MQNIDMNDRLYIYKKKTYVEYEKLPVLPMCSPMLSVHPVIGIKERFICLIHKYKGLYLKLNPLSF